MTALHPRIRRRQARRLRLSPRGLPPLQRRGRRRRPRLRLRLRLRRRPLQPLCFRSPSRRRRRRRRRAQRQQSPPRRRRCRAINSAAVPLAPPYASAAARLAALPAPPPPPPRALPPPPPPPPPLPPPPPPLSLHAAAPHGGAPSANDPLLNSALLHALAACPRAPGAADGSGGGDVASAVLLKYPDALLPEGAEHGSAGSAKAPPHTRPTLRCHAGALPPEAALRRGCAPMWGALRAQGAVVVVFAFSSFPAAASPPSRIMDLSFLDGCTAVKAASLLASRNSASHARVARSTPRPGLLLCVASRPFLCSPNT